MHIIRDLAEGIVARSDVKYPGTAFAAFDGAHVGVGRVLRRPVMGARKWQGC